MLAQEQEQRGSLPSQSSAAGRESEEAYQRAIQAQTGLVQANQNQDGQRAKLGRYLNNLGKLLAADRRWDEAEKTFVEVINMIHRTRRNLPGPRLAAPPVPLYNLATLPWLRSQETKHEVNKAHVAGAIEKARLAKNALERLREEFPEVPGYREELANVYAFLGWKEQVKTGHADLEQAIGLSTELARRFPNVPKYQLRLADACRFMAENLLKQNESVKAEAFARKSIEQIEKLKSRYPKVPEYVNVSLGRAFYELAVTLKEETAAWPRSSSRREGQSL